MPRWTVDGGPTQQETPARDTKLGVHYADLPVDGLPAGGQFAFTFHWTEGDRREGTGFAVLVIAGDGESGG